VIATGFAIDAALVGEAEARRRVLALWAPGAELRAHGTRMVITGLIARRVRVAQAPGAPLVEQGGVCAAMVIEPRAYAAGAIVLAVHGAAEVVAGPRIEVASWIDVAALEVVAVESLGAPPAVATALAVTAPALRAISGIPAPDPEAAAVVAALVAEARGAPEPARRPGSTWRARLATWLDGWRAGARPAPRTARRSSAARGPSALARLRRWFRRSPLALAAGAAPREPAPRSWLGRLRDRFAAALWRSQLGEVLGRQHAAYLQDLLALFERGELDEALRRAIPFAGAGDDRPRQLALGLPAPRAELKLQLRPHAPGTVVPIAAQAMALLHARYRAAAERLEQQGRIDEAAFVLVDLLDDVAGALALLERHQRFALAAQLAEARGLEPARIVWLWFRAGDVQRAVDAARRHDAWAAAIAELARRDPARADALRLIWADRLAAAGRFVAAIEVVGALDHARALVDAWLERGVALGGATAARLWIKRLARSPDELARAWPAVRAILDDRDPEAGRARAALAAELVGHAATPALRALARPVARAVIRERAAGDPEATEELIERVVRFADDAALRVDLPALTAGPQDVAPRALRWHPADAGAVPVFDAASLPGGRIVYALGELGVRLSDSRTTAAIAEPAHTLVVADSGARALGLARRGEVLRIARLDLLARRGDYFCDAACDGGARSYDGDVWLATRRGEVLAIDAAADRWRAIWGVTTDGRRCNVRRIATCFAIEASAPDGREDWLYDAFVLHRRSRIRDEPPIYTAARPGHPASVVARPGRLELDGPQLPLAPGEVRDVEVGARFAAIAQGAPDGVVVALVGLAPLRPVATLELGGATRARLRILDDVLTIGDDRGRVIVVDARTGAVIRELRTSS
jgi:hypothetical protein